MASYAHHCKQIASDTYQISWMVDYKHTGSRLRYPRRMTRITDEQGANVFCAKWKIIKRELRQEKTT